MTAFQPGRICFKIAGRDGGKYCVVVEEKAPFVTITGPKAVTGVKRRKCNMYHLEPTSHKLDVSSGSDDNSVEAAWKESGLIKKLNIEVPTKKNLHQAKKKS